MEGKKKYFVLVLFLLLALMIFAFANPIVEDDKEFQDNSKDKTEQVEKPDVIVDTEKDNNNNVPVVRPTQPVQNNQTTEDKEDEIDTTYEDALEAVKYAEATYKAEDVEKAKELVNKVTDTTKKGELEDRLAEVEAGIEVMELIKELEYQVGKATEREDIVSAKDYRDEKEVAKKLEALTNEEVKKALQERLDKVSKILDDETAPVVNIKNNEAFKEDVTITVEDDNEFYMYLSKDGKDAEKVENNHKTTGEGIYTLTVVDKALNETTIRFVVDGTAPVFKGLENTKHYDEFTVEVEDISEVTIMISKDGEEEKEIANNTKVTEEGTYKITATDEAGNTTTYWVAIDNTAPTIERTSSDIYPTTKQEVKVFDRYLITVEVTINGKSTIYERKDFTVGEHNENFAIELEFSSDGDYKIVATDHKGLTTTDEFTIDSIFPFIGNVKDGEYYNTDVEPEIVEKNIETIKLNNQDYNGEKISEEGTYTLVVTDKSGHSVSKTFTIDKTAPTIKNVEEGKYYKNVTPIVEDENLDTVKLYRIVGKTKLQVLTYKNGDAITTDGKYEIVATDKAGNAADPVVVTVEVYKADYYLEFEDVSTYTYNGTKQYPKAVIKDENGIVTGEVSYVIEDNKNATDAGTYKVTASTDTYTRVSSISKEFTIEQREVKVVFTHHNGLNTTYEYDGNNNPYTAKLVDNATNEYIQDLTIVYTNSRGNIATTLNAGTYTMTVVNPSELNYKVMNNLQETITIEKSNS